MYQLIALILGFGFGFPELEEEEEEEKIHSRNRSTTVVNIQRIHFLGSQMIYNPGQN